MSLKAMGAAGRRMALDRYGAERMVNELRDLYRTLLEQKHQPAAAPVNVLMVPGAFVLPDIQVNASNAKPAEYAYTKRDSNTNLFDYDRNLYLLTATGSL